jgi:hypothetical protein
MYRFKLGRCSATRRDFDDINKLGGGAVAFNTETPSINMDGCRNMTPNRKIFTRIYISLIFWSPPSNKYQMQLLVMHVMALLRARFN